MEYFWPNNIKTTFYNRGFWKFTSSTKGDQSYFTYSQSTMDPEFSTKEAMNEWATGMIGTIVYNDFLIPLEIMFPYSSNSNNNNINLVTLLPITCLMMLMKK